MKRHPSRKRIAAFVLGTLADGRALEIQAHLDVCAPCSRLCERLRGLITPLDRHKVTLPPEIRTRVLEFARRGESGETVFRSVKVPMGGLARGVRIGALTAAVALMALAVFLEPWERREAVPMKVEYVKGAVTVDGQPAHEGQSVIPGSSILTVREEIMKLSSESGLVMVVSGQSALAYKRSTREEEGGVNLSFQLSSGTVAIRCGHGSRTSISCLTPHARITPLGTVFMLRATPAQTLLVVAEGTVRAQSLAAAGRVDVTAGYALDIAGGLTYRRARTVELEEMDRLLSTRGLLTVNERVSEAPGEPPVRETEKDKAAETTGEYGADRSGDSIRDIRRDTREVKEMKGDMRRGMRQQRR